MIEERQHGARIWAKRWWLAAFVLLLIGSVVFGAMPDASAKALTSLTHSIVEGTAATAAEPLAADRILVVDGEQGETDVVLGADKKVTIRRGEDVLFATSREGERVSELLQREEIEVVAPELVLVRFLEDEILIEIGTDFTYYEKAQETATYETVYTTDYTLRKGESKVTRPGQDGTCDVTYEVVYADGVFVSRQAVAQDNDTSVVEIVSTGTLVEKAREGDTIDSVVYNEDGSGYLLLKSGDSLRFTHTMEVTCSAYTTGDPGVGTITYTGTTVHPGVVAVDKSVIPLGSWMFITTKNGDYTYGMGHAEDTGVHGKWVDLYMNSYNECIQFGLRNSIVYFLPEPTEA